MYYLRVYSYLFIIGITFFSCSKENYEAKIPAYISINQIILSTNLVTEGSSSSNITDAWVYIDNDLVGVFELPAKFPVLKEGSANLKVFAGIKDNGINNPRTRYLLYAPYEEQLNLVKGETLEINPAVSYASGVNFAWLEDFENASLSFLYSSGSDTIINKQSTDIKEGAFSGQVFLDANMDFFEATSSTFTTIPHNASPVYFELDFKTNEPLVVGIYIDTGQFAWMTLNTTNTWKKIYINLTDVINTNPPSTELKVFFGIKSTAENPFGVTNPEIFIDNLKLVHL